MTLGGLGRRQGATGKFGVSGVEVAGKAVVVDDGDV